MRTGNPAETQIDRETATGAVDTAQRLLALFQSDAERVRRIGRAAAGALRVFDTLRRRPRADVDRLARQAGVAYPTAARAVDALVDLGILRELTGRRRGRVFAYDRYVAILNEGAQPL